MGPKSLSLSFFLQQSLGYSIVLIKLIALINKSFTTVDPEASALGELAQSAHVTSSGFSKSRWLFWRQRLDEISQCCQEEVAKQARYGVHIMGQRVKEISLVVMDE